MAIALELRRRGHSPVIATSDLHRGTVQAEGIEFAPVRPGAGQLGDPGVLVRRLYHPRTGPEHLVRHLLMPHLRQSYEDLDLACQGADALITHPLAFAGPLVAERRGLPWISSVLAPISLMSVIDPPLIPYASWLLRVRRLGIGPYRLAFGLARRAALAWEAPLRELRAEIGLPPSDRPAQFEGQYSPLLNLALFPCLLGTRQPDWPENTVVCGFPRYDGRAQDPAALAELAEFLAVGEPPLVFTLGSSLALDPGDFFQRAARVAERLGRRAVLVTGRPARELGVLPGPVKAFAYVPYSALFTCAAAVVHGAGVGTLSQALAAGRPQLMLPSVFDQPDNARRAARLRVGLVLPFARASEQAMEEGLRRLLAEPHFAARAAEVGEQVRSEPGAERAAGSILGIVGAGAGARGA
jgi:UDP:flavonoid glycosyltransferase YjiC (YdhE family)